MSSRCSACTKPCYNKSGVHRACQFTLPAGAWRRGVVQTFSELTDVPTPAPTAPPVGPDVLERLGTLTPAQAEVLRLLAIGHYVNEISAIRVVSEFTTRKQISTMLARLDVQSVTLAVALAWRSGWITVSAEVEGGAA